MIQILIKRVYEPPSEQDGLRVLVDRVWPRGLKKEQVQADIWMKDVAPSTALRQWFDHDRSKWEEFKARYFAELDAGTDTVQKLIKEVMKGPITLLFSAHDTEYNQAVALREYLLLKFKEKDNP